MSQVTQLIEPTIDLFLYDIHDGLGQSQEKINQNRRRFWQRIYSSNLSEKKLDLLQVQEENFSSYIELLGSQRIEPFEEPWNGYYYPVKLGDTYALQIDCAGKKKDPAWYQLTQAEQLRQMKSVILEHINEIPGRMGQSWLIWGQLSHQEQNAEATAQACYEQSQIIPHPQWQNDLKGKGSFQDAIFFELEQLEQTADKVNRGYHVIVCLFPHEQSRTEIQAKIRQIYRQLIRLLQYRNKILWVHEQSCQLKERLKSQSYEMQQMVDNLPQQIAKSPLKLKKLQANIARALQISSEYDTDVSHLKQMYTTVGISTRNYQNRLQALIKQDISSNLIFLKRFEQFAIDKYLPQLKTDYQALSSGLKPLDNLVQTIEGIIALEQAKNGRSLNTTIAVASVGITAASLAAYTLNRSRTEEFVATYLPPREQSAIPLTSLATSGLIFSLSVGIGLVFALITAIFLALGRRR